MPDEIENLSPASSDAPGQLTITNEPTATANPPVESGRLQTINRIADGIAEKFGIKRGRGRPRKDGSPKISDVVVKPGGETVSARSEPALAAAVGMANPAADAILFHKCLGGAFKGALAGLSGVLRIVGEQAGLERDYLDKLAARVEPQPDALANFSEALDAVAKKHGINPENSPEWSLGLATARIVAPYGLVIFELRKEIARRREREEISRGN